RARVPPGGVPRPVRGALRACRAPRPLPRAQARRAPGRDRPARLGRRPRPARADAVLLRSLRPRDLRTRLRPARGARPRSRARPRGGAPPVTRARGRLAVVLHTHMPYVLGFGTWPFGEEWLWEALAAVHSPLLARVA